MRGCGLESPGLEQGLAARFCENGDEPYGSIKSGKTLD